MSKIVSVSKQNEKYFVALDDERKVRVDAKEYRRVKDKLARGYKLFIKVNEESDCIE